MVELQFFPRTGIMANCAFLIRIKLFRNKSFVYIGMTIDTSFANVSEFPVATIFIVTFSARCCQMCSIELEFGFIVAFHCKFRRFKTKIAVAGITVGCNTFIVKLSVMFILMAIGTTSVF